MNRFSHSASSHQAIEEVFDARVRALTANRQNYSAAAHRFLSYLQTEFPQVRQLSEVRRDPHLLGWLRCLGEEDPPLSNKTRQTYLISFRRLLDDLAAQGHSLPSELILPEDFPPCPEPYPRPTRPRPKRWVARSNRPCSPFQEIFDAHIQTLATTLRPNTTGQYRRVAHRFLAYLQTEFPQLRQLSEVCRDPHLLGWLRHLSQQDPLLSNGARWRYLLCLRRLLDDFASEGQLPPGLIRPEDFPPLPQYLPRALPPEEDQRLQQELRRTDDLLSNALLLTRATGIRIGECVHLAQDCLRSVGDHQWALHVPLGKLYTERLVPVDDDVQQMVARILELRALAPSSRLKKSAGLLLPRSSNSRLYENLRRALLAAAERAGCTHRLTCHQLRHTYATEMLRLGVSLPALMKLLGHKTINMTMRYLQVTQQDLQREYHLARQNAAQRHLVPELPLPAKSLSISADLPGIRQSLAATRHLVEMYRRQVTDEKSRRKLQRLGRRLLRLVSELDQFYPPAN